MQINYFWKGLPAKIDAVYENSEGKFVFFKGNRIHQNQTRVYCRALTLLTATRKLLLSELLWKHFSPTMSCGEAQIHAAVQQWKAREEAAHQKTWMMNDVNVLKNELCKCFMREESRHLSATQCFKSHWMFPPRSDFKMHKQSKKLILNCNKSLTFFHQTTRCNNWSEAAVMCELSPDALISSSSERSGWLWRCSELRTVAEPVQV